MFGISSGHGLANKACCLYMSHNARVRWFDFRVFRCLHKLVSLISDDFIYLHNCSQVAGFQNQPRHEQGYPLKTSLFCPHTWLAEKKFCIEQNESVKYLKYSLVFSP